MALGAVKFDNILNPEEAFREFKKYLIELYAEDYGEEYRDLIKSRIDSTYYLFESNPIDSYNFYKNYKGLPFGIKKRLRIEREYFDYKNVLDKIDKFLDEKYKNILSSYFGISSASIDKDFLNIDFESFSFENMRMLHSVTSSDENKNNIVARQQRYINLCNLYCVRPITDINVIDKLIKLKKDLEYDKYKYLLDESIWGKRIRKEIYLKTGKVVDSRCLGSAMYDVKCCASVCRILTSDNSRIRICLFPVMKNYDIGSTDKVFFHENRHVIESGSIASGLSSVSGDDYVLINELRTQENALRDAYEFRRIPLFANYAESPKFVNIYEKLFAYCGPFIKNYLHILNELGINNDILSLENLFGKNNLQSLEQYLNEVDVSLLAGFPDIVDIEKQRVLTYCLDRHFASRHF